MRVGALLGMTIGLVACGEQSPMAPAPASLPPPALSAASSSTELMQPFSRNLWIACAQDGAGEYVALVGHVAISSHTTEDAHGGMHISSHARPVGVVGLGASSGRRYRGTGGTYEGEHFWPSGEQRSWTFINNFRVIGQGPSNNVLVHLTIHQTYNDDGTLTADVDVSSHECR